MNDFLNQLKHFFKDGSFLPALAEEIQRPDGTLDMQYLQHLSEARTTQNKFTSAINTIFGQIKFEIPTDENEVTSKEFYEVYEFAKYPQVRTWIGHFWRTQGKLLTREKLHEYILNGESA